MNLRNKSKNLKETLIKQAEEQKTKKANKGDKRFLNYFDLKENEKMKIRLLPDGGDSGAYWKEYNIHSIKAKGVDSIRCSYESNGDPCDICDYSYNFHLEGDKDNNGKWRAHSKFLAQCIVLEAPFEVNGHDDEDENPVKLFSMPYGVYEYITEQVIEDQVGELMDTDFYIKKVKGSNGYNNYDKSYFAKNEDPLEDTIIDEFESGELKLYDFAEIVPEETTSEQMSEWLDHAIEVDKKASRTRTTTSSRQSDDEASVNDSDKSGETSSPKKSSARGLLDSLKKKEKNKE